MAPGSNTNRLYTFIWNVVDLRYHTRRMIQSPAFSTHPCTSALWCLRIELQDPGNVKEIHCYLHRICSTMGPACIHADVHLKVTGSEFYETESFFKNVTFLNEECACPSMEMKIKASKTALKRNCELQLICSFVTINTTEQMCMSNEKPTKTLNEISNIPGFDYEHLENLSEDLLCLLNSKICSDIILRVQDKRFYVHQVILEARLPKLASTIGITYHNTQSEVEVIGVTPTIMEYFLYYAYSGTIPKHVSNHLCELYNAAGEYDLKELQQLLQFTEVNSTAMTTMNIQRKHFTWNVDLTEWTVEKEKELITLPCDVGHAETIAISYKNIQIDSKKAIVLNFEFPNLLVDYPILMNCNVICMNSIKILFKTRFHHLFIPQTMCFYPLNLDMLGNSTSIRFRFEMELCDGEDESRIKEVGADFYTRSPFLHRRSLEKLSLDLGNLLNLSKCSDVVVETQCLKIHAHKAILAARSDKLFQHFFLFPTKNFMFIPNSSDSTLAFIIKYIYTGSILDISTTNLKEAKEVALIFNLPCLADELSSLDTTDYESENVHTL